MSTKLKDLLMENSQKEQNYLINILNDAQIQAKKVFDEVEKEDNPSISGNSFTDFIKHIAKIIKAYVPEGEEDVIGELKKYGIK